MSVIYLAASPEVDVLTYEAIHERVGMAFGFPVRRLAVLRDLAYAHDPKRAQYSSTHVLHEVAALGPNDAVATLAIVDKDLFIPMLTYVFGQAQLGGRAAVMSLTRLRPEFYGAPPDRALLHKRAATEAMHELGHAMGLTHCPEPDCAMSLATVIEQVDAKRPSFCPACSVLLIKNAADIRTRIERALAQRKNK